MYIYIVFIYFVAVCRFFLVWLFIAYQVFPLALCLNIFQKNLKSLLKQVYCKYKVNIASKIHDVIFKWVNF